MIVHVIPVPTGMSVEEAFAEIELLGELAEGRTVTEDGDGGEWATVTEDESDWLVAF